MKILKNKKVVLASAIILGISAITSSALAAYIITGGTVAQDETIDPSPITVDNQVVNLTVGDQQGELLFYPEETVSDERVTSDAEGNLTVKYLLTMNADAETKIPDITVTVTAEGAGALVDDQYVKFPAVQNITDTWEGSAGTFTKTLSLTWTWGQTFGGDAPTTYYNTGGDGDDVEDTTVISTLNLFKAAVDATTFKVSIKEKAAA